MLANLFVIWMAQWRKEKKVSTSPPVVPNAAQIDDPNVEPLPRQSNDNADVISIMNNIEGEDSNGSTSIPQSNPLTPVKSFSS